VFRLGDDVDVAEMVYLTPGVYPSTGISDEIMFDFVVTVFPVWQPASAQVFPPSPGEPVLELGAPVGSVCALLYTDPTKMVINETVKVRVSNFFFIIINFWVYKHTINNYSEKA
jgi:hypothetical protein